MPPLLTTTITTRISTVRDAEAETSDVSQPFPSELLVWLSPSFPVGSFAYSQGLETAVSRGLVSDRSTLKQWLHALATHGSLRSDLIVLSLIMRAETAARVRDLVELSLSLQPSAERWAEATVQGAAFREAYIAGWCNGSSAAFDELGDAYMTLAAALGIASRERRLPLVPVLNAYAVGFNANLVSASIRLGVIGQVDGQRVLSDLHRELGRVATAAADADENQIGGAAFVADLVSIQHETQTVRLFRS